MLNHLTQLPILGRFKAQNGIELSGGSGPLERVVSHTLIMITLLYSQCVTELSVALLSSRTMSQQSRLNSNSEQLGSN